MVIDREHPTKSVGRMGIPSVAGQEEGHFVPTVFEFKDHRDEVVRIVLVDRAAVDKHISVRL